MSDETKMNSDLEKFESDLQGMSVPSANINRDQLMYDAGWAAALSGNGGRTIPDRIVPTRAPRKLTSFALPFASGLAVACVVLLAVLQFRATRNPDGALATEGTLAEASRRNLESSGFASPAKKTQTQIPDPAFDLIDIVNELPVNQTISSRLAVTETRTDYVDSGLPDLRRKPPTASQLLRELLPNAPVRQPSGSFAAWMLP